MCHVVLEVQQSFVLTLFVVFHLLLRQVLKGCAMGALAFPHGLWVHLLWTEKAPVCVFLFYVPCDTKP